MNLQVSTVISLIKFQKPASKINCLLLSWSSDSFRPLCLLYLSFEPLNWEQGNFLKTLIKVFLTKDLKIAYVKRIKCCEPIFR